MPFIGWRKWLNQLSTLSGRSPRSRRRPLSRRPQVEALEARLAPATDIWTGRGANPNWMTAGNWSIGIPNAGDDLVFPTGAARLNNTNNFASGTGFNSITFSGSGYTLGGNRITLGGPGGGQSLLVGATLVNNAI